MRRTVATSKQRNKANISLAQGERSRQRPKQVRSKTASEVAGLIECSERRILTFAVIGLIGGIVAADFLREVRMLSVVHFSSVKVMMDYIGEGQLLGGGLILLALVTLIVTLMAMMEAIRVKKLHKSRPRAAIWVLLIFNCGLVASVLCSAMTQIVQAL